MKRTWTIRSGMVVALVTAMLAASVTSASAQPSTPSGQSAGAAAAVTPASCVLSGPWKITPKDSNPKVVEVPGGSTANGVQLDQWTDQGKAWEQWLKEDCGVRDASGNHLVAFINVSSGKCVNVAGGSTANGAAIIQYGCFDGNGNFFNNNLWWVGNGQWTEIQSNSSGRCLNVSGDRTDNGGPMIQWTCSTNYNNEFFWIHT